MNLGTFHPCPGKMLMRNIVAIILGGGRGTRLYPLTKLRAKPAVPIAGKYRLIDIPVSNCINSGIHKIFVLTQFNSASLNRHIAKTYQFSLLTEGFVDILAAQQTPEHSDWFQGTADAVRHYLDTLCEQTATEFVILSGDHLYRMDYRPFLEYHRTHNADITISAIPIESERAPELGILRINHDGEVTEFREKPKGKYLKEMRINGSLPGSDKSILEKRPYVASMGIYIFKKEVLVKLLTQKTMYTDFSKEIIPSAVGEYKIYAYLFHGYWEDIGTIESFYNANMQLVAHPHPLFDFYDIEAPIYTRPRFLPPTILNNSTIKDTMLCDGCVIDNAIMSNSIIGIRSRIAYNVTIDRSLVMGADFVQTTKEQQADMEKGLPPVGIGSDTIIRGAIIDKNARIGRNVKIVNDRKVQQLTNERQGYWISNGIVIVSKGSIIPDNSII